MGLLRATLFYLGISIVAVLITVPGSLLFAFPFRVRHAWLSLWARFTVWWLRVTCGIDFHVEGREHLPATPAVVLAKHQSAWETIAMQVFLPAQTWVLKRELLWIPFFGWGLAMCRAIAIDRGAGKKALKQVIEQGKDRLANGLWVIVFPEGTRMAPGERGRYAAGGAMLAEKAGVPVVPLAHNAGRFWPKKGFAKRPGTIQVVIGPPIMTQGRGAGAINEEAEAWIESQMARLDGVTA